MKPHPQAANAAEAKCVVGWTVEGNRIYTDYSDGTRSRARDIERRGREAELKRRAELPKYPHSPGEPIRLTDSQLREWRRDERKRHREARLVREHRAAFDYLIEEACR